MTDLIDRQAAIDALRRAEALTRAFGYHYVIDTIRELPPALPEKRTNERTETHARDCISRQAAIDAIQGIDRLATLSDNDAVVRMSAVEHVLFNLPSAQPYTDAEIQKMQDIEQAELQKAYELGKQDAQSERKRGQWIPQDHNKINGMTSTAVYYYPKCSVCGYCAYPTNFCPNCGADMRGEQDE